MELITKRFRAKKRIRDSGLLKAVEQLPRRTLHVCDGCAHPAPERVVTEDRYGLPIDVLVCPYSDLVSLANRLTPGGAEAFYDGLYRRLISAFHGGPITPQTVLAESKARSREIASVLSRFCGEVRAVPWVDVGGGTGGRYWGCSNPDLKRGQSI